MWWKTTKAYKNAISNELFLELTAWLHNDVPGDTTYLSWAKAEWSWFSASGMINSGNLVNDGLTSGCANNGGTTWTYNQGVILAGLAELYRATGDSSLLPKAESIASAAISALSRNGVLTEPCGSGGCDGDQQIFKGIFARDLEVLASTVGSGQYDSFLLEQARSVETTDTYASNASGLLWAGPAQSSCTSTSANPCTAATQASAEQALVAAPGPQAARPTAVAGTDGAIRVFARAADGSIQQDSLPPGPAAWSGFTSLGGTWPGNPAAMAAADGSTWVFVTGGDGALYDDRLPAGSAAWPGWTSLGEPATHLIGDPAVVQDHSGAVRVYVRGANGDLYQDTLTGGAWSGFSSMGGTWPYGAAALVGRSGYVHVFAVGTSTALYHTQLAPGSSTWSGWASLGGTVTGVPAAVQDFGGTIRCFARAAGGALEEFAAPSGSTSYAEGSRGGSWPQDPAALADSGGYVHLFSVAAAGAMSWQELPPGAPGRP